LPKHEKHPERQCLVTKNVLPKESLLRFVISPDGQLVADWAGKLPGRGMYTELNRATLAQALQKKLFARAAKQHVRIADDFMERTEFQGRTRVLSALSLVRKAGEVVAGFEKVEQALQSDAVLVLLHARDAGEDGVKKLAKYTSGLLVLSIFSRTELGNVLGRENPVHVAILMGNAGDFFLSEARRFALFLEKTTL
jgi:predicted RNA-binding protein YlxR (DUF448 family)/ribosomal protein L30E